MIFDTPNLRSGTGYPGDPTSLGEVFDVSNRGQYHIESVNALHSQIEEEYTARIKAIKDAAGVDFVHPLQTDPNVDRLMARANQRGRHWFNKHDILETQLEEASERLQELQKKHPDLADIIKADTPPHLDVYRRMRKIEGERGDVLTRRGLDSISGMLTDPIGTGAMFTGALWGMRNSPYDLLALVAGGAAGRPTYSLLRNALINATANAAAQALVEPAIQRNRAMAGLDAGWQQAMGNVAMAFGIGGTLDLAVRTPGRAFRWWQGQPNVGGVFRDAPSPVAPDVDPAPRAPVPRLPEIPEELISRAQQGDVRAMTDIAEMVSGRPVELPEGVTREMIGKALDGDPEALTQVIERSGMADDPAIKGALDRFILEGGDAEVQTALQRVRDEFAGVTTPEGGRIDIDIGQDEQRILQALRAAMDPDEPTPTGGMDLQIARRAALADDEPLPRGIVGTNQHELKIDIFGRPAAVRELDLKLTRLEGEVEALRARQWSDDLAGRMLAYEPREGPLVIMDGRRRAELAQRMPGEARAEAVVFREADGWTREDVAALARRKNIAEGKGSPVELAEALRTSPDLLDLIDNGTGVTRMARSLAMLSDDAFGMVKAGEADPRMAAMVSDMVGNEALHAQLLRDLKAAGIEDVTQARRSLNDLLPYQGQHEANSIMLGFDPDDMPLRAGADVEDPKGPAAKAQVQRLEQELAPEIADARAKGPPPPSPAETAAVAAERAANVRAAIAQVVGRMPEDFRVETFSAIGDLPDPIQAEVARGNAVAFSNALSRVQAARTPAARARALADLEAARRGEGVEGFERDGVVYVAAYAANPEAVVWHEIVHFLKRTGRLTDDEIALLARRARKENLFDEGLYREAMAGRDDLDAKLDEEAAAHLMQARKEGRSFGRKTDAIIDKALRTLEMIGNALRGYGFRTADDVVEAILSGEMARREAVRAVMRREDITAFAVRSGSGLDDNRSASHNGTEPTSTAGSTMSLKPIVAPDQMADAFVRAANEHLADTFGWHETGKGLADFDDALVDAGLRYREGSDDFPVTAFIDQEIDPAIIRTNHKFSYVEWRDAPDWLKQSLGIDTARLPKWVKEEDLTIDLHEFADGVVTVGLRDYDTAKKRFKADALEQNQARTVEDVFQFPNANARAASFEAWLNANGIPYEKERFNDVASAYFFVNLGNDEQVKVRFADHWQQSMHHDAADYNIVSNAKRDRMSGADEFRRAIAEISEASATNRGSLSLGRKTKPDEGMMFAFAGERARTADLEALSRAKEMETQGKDRTAIWNATGWFKGVDGKWRFEIDDSGIALRELFRSSTDEYGDDIDGPMFKPSPPRTLSDNVLEDAVTHASLVEAYPSLRDIEIVANINKDPRQHMTGEFSPRRAIANRPRMEVSYSNDAGGKSVILHELQHAVADLEGFDPGARPDPWGRAGESYWNSAGEVEARTVEKRFRRAFDPSRGRRSPPWLDYDVPEDQQIVHMGGEAMFALRQEERPLEGIHFTDADFDRFSITQRRDYGYWGRGVYMFPRAYGVAHGANSTLGLSYGTMRDGARNIPLVVDSKKPFVIDADRRPTSETPRGDWDALRPHGWEFEGPPVTVVNREDWDTIKRAIDTSAERAEAVRAEKDASAAVQRLMEVEEELEGRFGWDWRRAIDEPVNDALRQRYVAAEAASSKASEAKELALRKASPATKLASQFTDALLAAGYDAVVIRRDGTPYEMVAIKPGTVRGMFTGETMFALRQGDGTPAAPDTPDIDIPALAQRLIGIADTYRAAVSGEAVELPDTPSLSLGRSEDGGVTTVNVGEQTYFVSRDEVGNAIGLITPEQATERAIADTIRTTARDTGYDLDPERVDAYTAEAMAIVRTAQEDPQGALQAASDLIARISDEITPDEPAMRPDNDNEIPTPLRQDLADVDRLNEHAMMVEVCRA